VIETVREIKRRHAIEVIAGNVATAEGAKALADAARGTKPPDDHGPTAGQRVPDAGDCAEALTESRPHTSGYLTSDHL